MKSSRTTLVNIGETRLRVLLADETVPADTLVRRHVELVMKIVDVRVDLIKRVAVDSEADLSDKALGNTVDVTDDLLTDRRVGGGSGPVQAVGSSNCTEGNVDNHVREEQLYRSKLGI